MNSTKSVASSKRTKTSSLANGDCASGISEELRLAELSFKGDELTARFSNGSAISVDVNRYPRLRDATPAQRKMWRLTGKGSGVHWENIDEDLSVENLLFAVAKNSVK